MATMESLVQYLTHSDDRESWLSLVILNQRLLQILLGYANNIDKQKINLF